MVKLLFVLMNEYRLWALPQALAALERRYPGAVEGRVYSVREINADAGLERALLADGAAADMAFLASHGSIQNLYCFSRLWEALEGRPVYFTSTMGDELAELLPRLGLEPALYAALDSYYQAGSPGDLEGLVLCALNGRVGGDYPLSPPSPPRGQGVYTLEGFLPPEREAGYRTRMAAETRPVIGVLIHDHYARTGNLEHVDALLRAIQARGGVPYALSDSFAADHGTEQGILYRMERSSLPVGILRDIAFERSQDTLVDGDILLLASDGVVSAGVGWVEEALRDFDLEQGGVQELAESIAYTARQKQKGQREDDITVIALQVGKTK